MIGTLIATVFLATFAMNGQAEIVIPLDENYCMTLSIGLAGGNIVKAIVDTDRGLTTFYDLTDDDLANSKSYGIEMSRGHNTFTEKFFVESFVLLGQHSIELLADQTFVLKKPSENEKVNAMALGRATLSVAGTETEKRLATELPLFERLTLVLSVPNFLDAKGPSGGIMVIDDDQYSEGCDSPTRIVAHTISDFRWAFEVESLLVIDNHGIVHSDSLQAIVNPASPFISFPPAIFESVMEKIGLSVAGRLNCDYRDELPSLLFFIAGKEIEISAKQYIGTTAYDHCEFLIRSTAGTKYEHTNDTILGIPFLLDRCFHMNNDKGTVAFSGLKPKPKPNP